MPKSEGLDVAYKGTHNSMMNNVKRTHSRVLKAAQGYPSLAQDCTAAAESCLLIAQVKTAGCSGLETEMELGEVKIGG